MNGLNRSVFFIIITLSCSLWVSPCARAKDRRAVALTASAGPAFWSSRISASEQLGLGVRFAVSGTVDLEIFAEEHGLGGTVSLEEALAGGAWDKEGFTINGRAYVDLAKCLELFASLGAGKDWEDIYDDHANDRIVGDYGLASLHLGIRLFSSTSNGRPRLSFYVETGPDLLFGQDWRYPNFPNLEAQERYGPGPWRWFLGLGLSGEWWL